MSKDREPIEIVDPLVDPYKVTDAARAAISNGRRITGIDLSTSGTVRIESVPNQTPYVEGDIPGVNRPYKITENLSPADRAAGGIIHPDTGA